MEKILLIISFIILIINLILIFLVFIRSNIKGQLDDQNFKLSSHFFENFQKLTDRFNELQNKMSKELAHSTEKNLLGQREFGENLSRNLQIDFKKLGDTMENRLHLMSNKMREELDQGFKKTNETFNSVMQRLTRIDEAQKNIEKLSNEVVSLQDVLTDKKSRGIFGEIQLHQILSSAFGEKNDRLYQLQYTFPNKMIVDAVLFLPEPTGMIPIDSKFPLENFRRTIDLSTTEAERMLAEKEFKKNLKKHIDDISEKYVAERTISSQAILFLPAEAIFAHVTAYYSDLLDYAHQKHVSIASPTTLWSLLSTIQVVINNIETSKYAHIIQEELVKLSKDFSRYKDRWDKLASHVETVNKDIKDIHISTGKITTKFEQIAKVEFKGLEHDET